MNLKKRQFFPFFQKIRNCIESFSIANSFGSHLIQLKYPIMKVFCFSVVLTLERHHQNTESNVHSLNYTNQCYLFVAAFVVTSSSRLLLFFSSVFWPQHALFVNSVFCLFSLCAESAVVCAYAVLLTGCI